MAINSIGSASRSDYSMTEAPKGRAEVEGEEFSGAVAAADLVVALAGQRPVEAAKLCVPHQDQQVAAPSGGIQAAASGKLDRAVPGNAGEAQKMHRSSRRWPSVRILAWISLDSNPGAPTGSSKAA